MCSAASLSLFIDENWRYFLIVNVVSARTNRKYTDFFSTLGCKAARRLLLLILCCTQLFTLCIGGVVFPLVLQTQKTRGLPRTPHTTTCLPCSYLTEKREAQILLVDSCSTCFSLLVADICQKASLLTSQILRTNSGQFNVKFQRLIGDSCPYCHKLAYFVRFRESK